MKRINLKNGDFIEIILLKHSIRAGLYDKMGYAKEYKYFTDEKIVEMLDFEKMFTEESAQQSGRGNAPKPRRTRETVSEI